HKSLDVITLFHKASSPASIRAQTLLKQVSAHASETATEDQATDHSHQNKLQRTEFELNVTEDPPTSDQLRTILEYVGAGAGRAGQIVEGAVDEADALRKLKEDPNRFQRPVVGLLCPPSSADLWVLAIWQHADTMDRLWIGTMVELVRPEPPRVNQAQADMNDSLWRQGIRDNEDDQPVA
ncbi:MAG: hypothetical protein Q9188_002488, partial [Gyalolechia gomerana]